MKNNLINDISSLTNIPTELLESIVEKCDSCICHSVLSELIERNAMSEIDIGIGTLYIKIEDESIKYKFIPSERLEENVRTTVATKCSPLVISADRALKSRVEKAYKQFI